jgi:hypothetical protein
MKQKESITADEYEAFQQAYDFFNRELFAGALPNLLIVMQRGNYKGYFAPDRFRGRTDESKVHELALNPDEFTGRTDKEILGTLGHEQSHVWQATYGTKIPKRSYHNREWAEKMKEIGLYPSDTGQPGGKETGFRVSHYIIPGGSYDQAYRKLEATGFGLHWQSTPQAKEAAAKLKTKFTCERCGLNAWAKSSAHLTCTDCGQVMAAEDSNREKRRQRPASSGKSEATPVDHRVNGHMETPDCLAFFGLTLPTNLKALKSAYRRRVKQTHPDHGGDSEKFRQLQAQYEAATAYLEQHEAGNAA